MRTLIIDNYDSYTFNLYQLIAEVNGRAPDVLRNDDPALKTVDLEEYDNIVLSPGPGTPAEAGVTAKVDQATREAGLLVYPCAGIIDGVVGDSILMVPPLVISREEIGLLVDRLDTALERVSREVLA